MQTESLHNSAATPQNNGKKNIKETGVRWLMLKFACNFLLGSYYCFDNPSVLETQMEK